MAAKKKEEPKDCCPVMTLALDQAYDHKGLATDMFIKGVHSGKPPVTYHAPVIYFKRVPRGQPCEGATYAKVDFCPFCGKKQTHAQEPEEKNDDRRTKA